MAIYHLSAQIIKRSEGRSAIAAAAYRAGERLVDRENGLAFDYRNKGGIVHSEIRTPGGAPDWMQNREELWNVLEVKNRRKDAQLAREMNIALPKELPLEQQRELLRRFVDEQFVDRGMVADMAIHHDQENNNPHAHVMLSFYAANENGFRHTRTREWNSKDFLTETRGAWSQYANRALEAMGRDERIDHRTLEAQGIDRMPTIHEGPQGRKARERGFEPASNVVDIRTYAGKRRRLDYRDIDVGRSRAAQNERIHAFNERQATKRLVEAMDAVDNWLRHRFLEATIKRAGTRLRDARRTRRGAEGSIRFWAKVLKQRQRASTIERVIRNRPKHVARLVRQVGKADRSLKLAKRRYVSARQQELTADRDYRQAKLALGRNRTERKLRRQRSVARWTSAVNRVAPKDMALQRLPEHRSDGNWTKVLGWIGKARLEERRQRPKDARIHQPHRQVASNRTAGPSMPQGAKGGETVVQADRATKSPDRSEEVRRRSAAEVSSPGPRLQEKWKREVVAPKRPKRSHKLEIRLDDREIEE